MAICRSHSSIYTVTFQTRVQNYRAAPSMSNPCAVTGKQWLVLVGRPHDMAARGHTGQLTATAQQVASHRGGPWAQPGPYNYHHGGAGAAHVYRREAFWSAISASAVARRPQSCADSAWARSFNRLVWARDSTVRTHREPNRASSTAGHPAAVQATLDGVSACTPWTPSLPAASFAGACAAAALAVGGCMPVAVDWRPAGELIVDCIVLCVTKGSIATLPLVAAATGCCISDLLVRSIWRELAGSVTIK